MNSPSDIPHSNPYVPGGFIFLIYCLFSKIHAIGIYNFTHEHLLFLCLSCWLGFYNSASAQVK